MQHLIKQYFWLVGALTVLTCSFFTAKAVGHVVEGKLLTDAAVAPKIAAIPAKLLTPKEPTRSKDGTPIADRDMFCSDCTPAAPVVEVATATDSTVVQITSLPLMLIATNVSGMSEFSFGSILNTESQRQGAYYPGDVIPGAGPVEDVHYKYLDFHNQAAANRLERVMLVGEAPIVAKPVVAAAEPPADGNPDDLKAAIEEGIKKIDDTHYEISRSLVDKVLLNPMALAKGARVVPSVKNGKPDGFKMYAIKPDSVFSKLGFSNGDTMHAVNGFEMTSADKALEMYTKLKEANSLQVDVTRRGEPVVLNYNIR